MKRRTGLCLTILILGLFLSACGRKGADKSGIRIYYLNKADHALQEQNFTPCRNRTTRLRPMTVNGSLKSLSPNCAYSPRR